MDKLVKRVTAVSLEAGGRQADVIYRASGKKRRKVSPLLKPFERIQRKLLESQEVGGREGLRLHEKSNRKRRDGWLADALENQIKSNRKAYNVARKALPGGVLPKA
ncbi:hypothetical protein [Methylobacterium nonmethylotrophicum]|uniref:Uncharacterized protein n=1 Tax=Methylobacterium nonmethylotrophicum TaxID=1141884 RepID=A0A4Z0NSA8_9HYPH|nr:hypothetical protein [Methylobacterium nonmethylotrophicum]TGD98917.1 hypothetical protein EU555_13460 [Methylobacterium nonmethylotrophicum]